MIFRISDNKQFTTVLRNLVGNAQVEEFKCDMTCISVLGLTAEKEDRLHCKGLAGGLETLQGGQVLAMLCLIEAILSLKNSLHFALVRSSDDNSIEGLSSLSIVENKYRGLSLLQSIKFEKISFSCRPHCIM